MLLKDFKMLEEAYKKVSKQDCGKKCDCKKCKHSKPDFLDLDKDGDTKEPLKKAVKDKQVKESLSPIFDAVFESFMEEGYKKSPISGPHEHDKKVWALRRLSNGEISNINKDEQYIVSWKNPEKHNNKVAQPLKGESVEPYLNFKDFDDLEIKSIRRPEPEDDFD